MRQFFSARGIAPSDSPGDTGAAPIGVDEDPEEEKKAEQVSSALLSTLPVIDRIKISIKGTREQRSVLIRDSNKLVSVAVLGSPKVTESEVEVFARMANVSGGGATGKASWQSFGSQTVGAKRWRAVLESERGT